LPVCDDRARARPVRPRFGSSTPLRGAERPKGCATAQIHKSLISHGCVIEGTVVNSVLSPGVRVDVGAVVPRFDVMFDSRDPGRRRRRSSDPRQEVVVGQGAIVGEGPYDGPPNRQEPGRLNTGITVVASSDRAPRRAPCRNSARRRRRSSPPTTSPAWCVPAAPSTLVQAQVPPAAPEPARARIRGRLRRLSPRAGARDSQVRQAMPLAPPRDRSSDAEPSRLPAGVAPVGDRALGGQAGDAYWVAGRRRLWWAGGRVADSPLTIAIVRLGWKPFRNDATG